MVDIFLHGIDNEIRIKLLPKDQEILKDWESNGELLSSYMKIDMTALR